MSSSVVTDKFSRSFSSLLSPSSLSDLPQSAAFSTKAMIREKTTSAGRKSKSAKS